MQTRRDVFQAIADPTRREIISLVAYQSMNLNNVADNFKVSRPAISQHIKILVECGLIIMKQQGRERYCEAKLEGLREVAEWADCFRRLWAERFDLLDDIGLKTEATTKKGGKKKKGKKKKKHKT